MLRALLVYQRVKRMRRVTMKAKIRRRKRKKKQLQLPKRNRKRVSWFIKQSVKSFFLSKYGRLPLVTTSWLDQSSLRRIILSFYKDCPFKFLKKLIFKSINKGPNKFLNGLIFLYQCNSFTRDGADSVTDCSTAFRSKTCSVMQVPCKRKADSCTFLSVQKFLRTYINGVIGEPQLMALFHLSRGISKHTRKEFCQGVLSKVEGLNL